MMKILSMLSKIFEYQEVCYELDLDELAIEISQLQILNMKKNL